MNNNNTNSKIWVQLWHLRITLSTWQ